jgi:hypothetical protein
MKVTHLLWADDLVMLALDKLSLQAMINELHSFSEDWGLQVNIKKTAILIFNFSGRLLLESSLFTYGDTKIPAVREYCYLGTMFTISGSTKINQEQLRIKGLRAYFSLKSTIDISSISKEAIFKLFDSLISPVVTYGCQVWLPTTKFIDCTVVNNERKTPKEIITAISKDPIWRDYISACLSGHLVSRRRPQTSRYWAILEDIPLEYP